MKKNRFLILAGLLVLLLSGCAGRVVATGSPGLAVYGDRAFLASGGFVYSVDVTNGTEKTTTDAKGNSVPIRYQPQTNGRARKNVAFGSTPAAVSADQMVIGNAFSNTTNHEFFSFNPQTLTDSSSPWPYAGSDNLWMGSPAVIDGLIYAPNSDGGLYVFTPTGSLKGKFQTGGSLWSAPITDGKLLYVSSMDHSLYAVNPANLTKAVWQAPLDASIVSAPLLVDGKLYVGTINSTLYCVDAATGKIIWHQPLDGGIWASPAQGAAAAGTASAAPVTSGTAGAATETPGTASTATATPATAGTATTTPGAASPAVGAAIYVGTAPSSTSGTLYAIDPSDGSTIWTFKTSGGIGAAPIVHEDTVFFVTEDGKIQAVTAAGKTVAGWPKTIEGSKFYTTPVLSGDLLLVAPTNTATVFIAAYTFDGVQKWVFSPNSK